MCVAAQLADTARIEALAVKLAEQPRHRADGGARQLRPRRELLRLPDDGAHGRAGRVAADVAGHAVPSAAARRRASPSRSRSRARARTWSADRLLPRRRRDHRGGRQRRRIRRWPRPANGSCRCTPAQNQRGRDQELHRQAVAGARIVSRTGRTTPNCSTRSKALPDALRAAGTPTGRAPSTC